MLLCSVGFGFYCLEDIIAGLEEVGYKSLMERQSVKVLEDKVKCGYNGDK